MRWWGLLGIIIFLISATIMCLIIGTVYNLAYAQDKCTAQFEANKPVTIEAIACPGSYFVRWEGACAGQGPKCTITMDTDKVAVAVFDLIPYPERLRLLEFDRFTARDLLRCTDM